MKVIVTYQDLFDLDNKDVNLTPDRNEVELDEEPDLVDVLFGPSRIYDIESYDFKAIDFRYHYVKEKSWLCTDEMAGYTLYTVRGEPFCAAYRAGRRFPYEFKFLCANEALEEVRSCVKLRTQITFAKITDEIDKEIK